VYPAGRLDLNSEGLLIMTNDGELANAITHPSGVVEKKYLAWILNCREDTLQRLSKPFVLDGYKTAPAKVRMITPGEPVSLVEIVIHEGRNRQIRRMCEACEVSIVRLKRISEGRIELGDLAVGKWRDATERELAYLESLKAKGSERDD